LASGVPLELRSKFKPEGATSFRVEMPLDDLAHVSIELGLGFLGSDRYVCRGKTHSVISLLARIALVLAPWIIRLSHSASSSISPLEGWEPFAHLLSLGCSGQGKGRRNGDSV